MSSKTDIILLGLLTLLKAFSCYSPNEKFEESLFVKPLPSGHVYTQFQFVIQKDLSSVDKNAFQHYQLFPRSLGEIIHEYDVQELHFSLTQGLWRYEKWGYPIRDAPPGAELWALFKGNISRVSSNWKKLTNVMSGQFCASLNFIDNTITVIPKQSFKPEGVVIDGLYDPNFIRYSSLPRETVCTENLTPFRKLLPCGYQAGLSTLLNALKIFNAHFVSLAVDVQFVCRGSCSNIAVQLVQSVAIVFDLPVQLKKQDWSLVKLFGSSLSNTCPVASRSNIFVDISSNKTENLFSLIVTPTDIIEENDCQAEYEKRTIALYDLKQMFKKMSVINVAAVYKNAHIYGIIPPPILYVDRKLTGYGQQEGGISYTFQNNHPKKPLKIIFFDIIPWYIRLYSHTLTITNGNSPIIPDSMYYKPAKDRSRPHHLELVLTLPPKSQTELKIDFDFAFLKWTEYPPDANHGFYINSAVVSTLLDTNKNFSYFPGYKQTRIDDGNFLRIHTKILLISLPVPDFSMPYNVICLTCTVVALAFGPIHNITTKSLQPLDENRENPYVSMLKKQLKLWWKSWKERNKDSEDQSKKNQ